MSEGRATRSVQRFRSQFCQIFVIAALALAVIAARSLLSARTEWESGQRALKEGRASLAIAHFRRSAGWYVPLSPYTARALEMLDFLAEREAGKGNHELARLATRSKTSARHSARNVTSSLPSDPEPFFSVLALLGWLTWSLAALLLVTRGLDADSRINERASRAMVAIVMGMAVFALGLALA